MRHQPRGFIALMSAVIISAVLLSVAITGSLAGFLERSNNLYAELKTRSDDSVKACVDEAFLQIATNSSYIGTTTYALNLIDVCRVAVSGGSVKLIRAQATSSNMAVTNLQVTYSTTTSTVLSWQEVPVF